MKQTSIKILLYLGLGTILLGAVLIAVITLLCWLTPSVSVVNNSQETLSNIVIQLPSNRLSFDDISPGESLEIFYDVAQDDGQYQVKLQRGSDSMQVSCGAISSGEWGKRMIISVSADSQIDCNEQFRF